MKSGKQALVDAMKTLLEQKPINKISVSEVLSLAGVSRQTFYRHYTDKYDLVFGVYLDTISHAVNEYNETKDFNLMSKRSLTFFKENHQFFRNAFKATDVQNSFFEQFVTFCVQNDIELIGRAQITPELIQLIEIYSYGTTKTTVKWLDTGMQENIDDMVKLYERALPPQLHNLFFPKAASKK